MKSVDSYTNILAHRPAPRDRNCEVSSECRRHSTHIASSDAVRRHYDLMSLPYRMFWGDHLHHGLFETGNESPGEAQEQLLDYCASLVPVAPHSNVLDVGCGYGGTATYLARHFDCHVRGLTLSPKQARIAMKKIERAQLSSRAHVETCDVERAPLTGNYDLIWMMESSEHLRDKAGFIVKAARQLRPGGKLLIAAWTCRCNKEPFISDLARLTVCPSLQSAVAYASQLREAGLHLVAAEDLTSSVIRTWEICKARVERFRFLWPFLPAEIQEFLRAIPLMLQAYREGLMSYTILLAENRRTAACSTSIRMPEKGYEQP